MLETIDAARIEKLKGSGTLDALCFMHGTQTALTHECGFGRHDSVSALLAAGADPDAQSAGRSSPLLMCLTSVKNGWANWSSARNCMQALLDAGARMEKWAVDQDGPSFYAIKESNVLGAAPLAWLLAKGLRVGAAVPGGMTLLDISAFFGSLPCAKLLVENGADVSSVYEVRGANAAALRWARSGGTAERDALVAYLKAASVAASEREELEAFDLQQGSTCRSKQVSSL